jgi:hypothetical protein
MGPTISSRVLRSVDEAVKCRGDHIVAEVPPAFTRATGPIHQQRDQASLTLAPLGIER